ncbi:hypothetical protein ElyMa_003284300 [Elysia marginata]|uniref:Uncharacterized protein n=1 Tax=Elysia marginata TaxID=1093978 RepID=A0AAV4JCQ9_9GAST|nr:hypothetical protein ElyMa_003284300 [Elysia marginata]
MVSERHQSTCMLITAVGKMLHYLLWRVLTGRHAAINLSFLITGHTKFAPDGAFGLIKRRYTHYRKTCVNSLADLADVVTSSSKMNLVQSCGNEAGEVIVPSYKWTAYFVNTQFKKVAGIKKFQHFTFLADGSVAARLAAELKEEKYFHPLKSNLSLPNTFPDVKKPAGLDLERQNY